MVKTLDPIRISHPLAIFIALAAPALGGGKDVVVLLKPGGSIDAVTAATGTVVVHSKPGSRHYVLATPGSLTSDEYAALLLALYASSETEYAEAEVAGTAPESGQTQQNTIGFVDGTPTESEKSDQLFFSRMRIAEALAEAPAGQVIVAVIDTGIDPDHADFAGKLASLGYDFVLDQPVALDMRDYADKDGDGLMDEAYGHGTHVASTIQLVNPNARILPLRVADSDGRTTSYRVAAAIEYAIAQGARVINLSLSFGEYSDVVAEAAHHAVVEGISVFTSAGNTGAGSPLFPANLSSKQKTSYKVPGRYSSGVIAVAAVDDSDVLADFSAWGDEVDLCVPGVEIYAAFPDGAWARWSGTSMACAVASGIASIVEACDPNPSRSAAERMIETAVTVDEQNPGLGGALGWGVPDALEAVLAVH